MQTFSVTTLGCKVNQYESDQIATLLRARGLRQLAAGGDLRVINTCSVTIQAASKSRQITRRATRNAGRDARRNGSPGAPHRLSLPVLSDSAAESCGDAPSAGSYFEAADPSNSTRPRVIVTGCWATSDPQEAAALQGVDAVLGHHDAVAEEIDRLLAGWGTEDAERFSASGFPFVSPRGQTALPQPLESIRNDGWMNEVGTPAGALEGQVTVENAAHNKTKTRTDVNDNSDGFRKRLQINRPVKSGTISLPQLDARQTAHQRAFLKIQDGCDAHCTYCIIPQLRPKLWSKPIDEAVAEAQRLVDAGHLEIVLTGIFLGAFGHATALRRRQNTGAGSPLGELVQGLCTRVRGLHRLRLSSLEPGDLSSELIEVLKGQPQVVPHFHLPLQSGSDRLLRRMNRQYTRDDFLRMVDAVSAAFDRPAFTTDAIVGFPGENDEEFQRTLEVVDRARFIHVHAFPYSPRPRTAAARWTRDFVRGPVVNQRIELLGRRAAEHSFAYRRRFLGETVELLVERDPAESTSLQHGRCERYFSVHFESDRRREGELLELRIDRVTPERTLGTIVRSISGSPEAPVAPVPQMSR